MKDYLMMTTDINVDVYFRVADVCAFYYKADENFTAVFVGNGHEKSAFTFPNDHTSEIIEAIDALEKRRAER